LLFTAKIVGHLRFYPRVVCNLEAAGGLCLLQDFPNGPTENFAETEFPPLAEIKDKTLSIHSFMTGSPHQQDNPCQRKGIGSLMKFSG